MKAMRMILPERSGLAAKRVGWVLSALALVAAATAHGAEYVKEYSPEEACELLRTWTKQIRSNYKQVKTWQGSFSHEDKMVPTYGTPEFYEGPANGELCHRHSGTAEFAVDAAKDALFVAHEYVLAPEWSERSGNHRVSTAPTYEQYVLTPEHFLHSNPHLSRSKPSAVREAPEKVHLWLSGPRIDPRHGFRGAWLADDLRIFEQIVEGERKNDVGGHPITLKLLSTDDRVSRYLLTAPRILVDAEGNQMGTSLREDTIEVGETVRVLRTVVMDGDRTLRSVTESDYLLLEGTDMPLRVERSQYRRGRLVGTREITFQTRSINEPVDPALFTVAALDLQEGDRYADEIEDVVYTYRDGELK
ncbi:MAG: hypothetical protein GY851_12465 [bacterium]|nr:hypothetical protein [bacterium]